MQGASPSDREPVQAPTWSRTRALIASDFRRLLAAMGDPPSRLKRVFWFLLPNFQALFWYRIYRALYLKNWRNLAWSMYLANTYLTRIEIPPATSIGESCFIGHFPIVLSGRIGDRFTFFGHGGTGGGMDSADIGGGPGLPVIGDDVVMAVRAMVLGPVCVGHGAHLGPACTVMRDVPAGGTVVGPASRVSRAAGAAGDLSSLPQPIADSPEQAQIPP